MIVVYIIILIYIVMMFSFWIAWRDIAIVSSDLKSTPKVSVIVVARNEELNIPRLMTSLSQQNYDNWELIIVNDHSTDDTSNSIALFDIGVETRIVEMPENRFGKKAGLALAIQESKAEFILCTDADCEFDHKWISSMMSSQQRFNARFVFGPVDIASNGTFFSRLQRMEFWGLIGSGASSLQLGVPSMCNGANLLFEKKAFNTVGGYADIQRTATGDDVLLMMKLRERFPDSVVFCKNAEAIVKTTPQLSLRDFFSQRSRWASKFSVYKTIGVKVIALVVFASYLSILVAVPLIIFLKINVLIFLSIMLVKLMVDYLFLQELRKFYKSKFDLVAFILLQFIMPFYVTFFGIIGRRKTFRWKDRTCT